MRQAVLQHLLRAAALHTVPSSTCLPSSAASSSLPIPRWASYGTLPACSSSGAHDRQPAGSLHASSCTMETRPWHQRDTGAGAASTSSCPWLPVPFARGLSTAASTPSATPPASASAPALESAPDIEPFTPSVSASAPEPDRFSSGARRVVRLGGRRDATGLHGIVHLLDSSSNTILTFTDPAGRVLAWMSAGRAGFKNSRKGLPVAAEAAAEKLAKRALELGYTSASVKMKGIGNNKQYAVQSLAAAGLKLTQLKDVTAIPYNGCRRPKKRRL